MGLLTVNNAASAGWRPCTTCIPLSLIHTTLLDTHRSHRYTLPSLVHTDHASSSPDPTPLLPTLPNTHAVVQVKGPEPGYVATPIIMVNAALALMHARERLDVPCGVWTAGALLRKTDLLGRLQRNGVTFEVVEEPGAAGVHVPLATAHTWGKTKKKP